jgi:hypothetical protein
MEELHLESGEREGRVFSLQKVHFVTTDGALIEIEFVSLIHEELEEGVHILAGKVYDIFA